MKKIIVTFSFFLFIAFNANAQFGVRAGVNLANVSVSDGDESLEYSNLLGFQAGVTYDYAINENLSFNPGLLFSMKGAKFNLDFGGTTFESKTKLNYIEVPLDFSYAAGAVNINAGPYVALLMSANVDAEGESMDIKDDVKGVDFGLNFGLSYDVNEMISVGAQYGLGLSNIDDSGEGSEVTIKNKVISFYAGYAF